MRLKLCACSYRTATHRPSLAGARYSRRWCKALFDSRVQLDARSSPDLKQQQPARHLTAVPVRPSRRPAASNPLESLPFDRT